MSSTLCTRGDSLSGKSSVLLVCADLVLVMQQKHKQRLLATFPSQMKYKPLHVLDIPDDYKYMDPELVEEITSAVGPLIDNFR